MLVPFLRRLADRLRRRTKKRRPTPPNALIKPQFEAFEDRLLPASIVWSGAVNSNWSTRDNWRGGVMPGPSDQAVFDASAANRTAVVDAGFGGTVRGLSSNWTGQIVLNRSLTVSTDFLLADGTIDGMGPLTLSGAARWEGGAMNGTGITAIAAGSTLAISGPVYKYLSQRTVSNAGTITWNGTGAILAERGSTIQNLAGATFDAQTDGYITFGRGPAGTIANAGTLRKSAGTGAIGIQVPFNNSGTMDVQAGAVNLSWGGVSTGAFHTAAGTAVLFTGLPYTLSDGATVTGDGFARVNGGTSTIVGNVRAQNVALEFGALDGPGNLTTTGTFNWTGGTMTGTGSTIIAATGTLVISGSDSKSFGQRTLENAGSATWTGTSGIGTGDGGSIHNQAGAIFDMQSDANFFSALGLPISTFVNAGTVRKSAGIDTSTFSFMDFTNTGTLEVSSGTLYLASSFTNFFGSTLTGGTYQIGATLQFNGAHIATNAANLMLDGPRSRVTDQFGRDALAGFANNTGTFTLQSGRNCNTGSAFSTTGGVTIGDGSTLTTSGDYHQTDGSTVLAGGTLAARNGDAVGTVAISGGTLSGSGTIDANVVNAGQISVGDGALIGLLSVTGDYAQTGTLTIKIGGADAGTFDQLAVGGRAAFAGGTLTVVIIDGFRPDPSIPDRFPILTFGAHDSADDFAVYNGLDLGDGLTLVPGFDDTSLTLVANQTALGSDCRAGGINCIVNGMSLPRPGFLRSPRAAPDLFVLHEFERSQASALPRIDRNLDTR